MNEELRDFQTRPVCVEGEGQHYRPSRLSQSSVVIGAKITKFVSLEQLVLDSLAQRNIVFFCMPVLKCCFFCYENSNSKKKREMHPSKTVAKELEQILDSNYSISRPYSSIQKQRQKGIFLTIFVSFF